MESEDNPPGTPYNSIAEVFPLNVVEKIVQHVPLEDRWNLSLVSKEFYETVCYIDKLRHKIRIFTNMLDDEDCMQSILNSKRKLKTLETFGMQLTGSHLQKLIDIAAVHGGSVRQLIIVDFGHTAPYELNANEFGKFLECFSNLLDWIYSGQERVIIGISGTCRPILKKLQKFSCCEQYDCDDNSADLTYQMASFIAPNTLVKLNCCSRMKNFAEFLDRQQNIKSIKFSCCGFLRDISCFKNLKLKEVCFKYLFDENFSTQEFDAFMPKLFDDHAETLQKITFPDFYIYKASSVVIQALCHRLLSLQEFVMELSNENIAYFLDINRLDKLEKLTIILVSGFTRFDLLLELSQKEMRNITDLKIVSYQDMDFTPSDFDFIAFLRNLGQNWCIQKLKVESDQKCSLNSILKSFPDLRELKVKCQLGVFDLSGQNYPKITKLCLHNWFSIRLPIHLISSCLPNLTYLEIWHDRVGRDI